MIIGPEPAGIDQARPGRLRSNSSPAGSYRFHIHARPEGLAARGMHLPDQRLKRPAPYSEVRFS
jgi:hypothetical protein